jgi:hypothetical protein
MPPRGHRAGRRSPDQIDGCSDLLVEVFGEAGRHARSAVGMAELPFDIAVEIELVAEVGSYQRCWQIGQAQMGFVSSTTQPPMAIPGISPRSSASNVSGDGKP